MEFQLIINHDDAIKMLENAGIEVKLTDTPVLFKGHGNSSIYVDTVPVWMVKNPQNGKTEAIHSFIKKYINNKKNELFLSPSKLDLYNLFDK